MTDRTPSPDDRPLTPSSRNDRGEDVFPGPSPDELETSDEPAHGERVDATPPPDPRPSTLVVDEGTGSPDRPRVSTGRDGHWFWPLVNLIGLLLVVIVNGLANWLPFNDQTTADVITKDPIPFQPAGWVFLIWGLIYVLLGAFVIYGLLPGGRRNIRLLRISPFFLVANVANITWLFLWHWEQFAASIIAMAVLLVSLLVIYIGLRIRNPVRRSVGGDPTRMQRLITWTPFSVYLGWICVAALANLMVWLDRSGWDGGPFSYNVWAAIFLVGGTLVAAVFAFVSRDVLIPLVFVWAFVGIAQQEWGESALVSVTAIVFAVVAAALAVAASLLSFDHTNESGMFGRKAVTPTSTSPMP